VVLNFPGSPPIEIVDHYERVTGKRIIRDANLTGPNIYIVAPEPVPKAEAIRLMEASLLLNGFVFVPAGENTVKILNAVGGKSPRAEGVQLYASASALPGTDSVVSYFMPLSYISTEEALPIIQAHVVINPQYGALVPVPNAQALLITEKVPLIRQVIGLRELIDVPPAKISTEFIELKRANAERVVETINQLIEKRKSSQGRPGAAPNPGNPQAAAAAAAAAAAPDPLLSLTDAQIIADPRTNRIIIMTRPTNVVYLRNLVLEFDRAVTLMDPFEMPLRYLPAAEALPVLADLLAEEDDQKGAAIGGPGQTTQTTQTTQQNRSTRRSSTTTSSSTGGGGAGGAPNLLDAEVQDTAPQSISIGKTTLIADNRANSILVLGPPESRDKVRTILERLDKRPMQVYLSTVIGQLTLGDDIQTGIDVLQRFVSDGTHGVASSLISRLGDGEGSVIPGNLTRSDLFPRLAGLSIYGSIDDVVDILVKGVDGTNRFRILSRPSVYTANNKPATIESGQRVAVPTTTLSDISNGGFGNNTNTAVQSNIQYEDVVLKLEVLPLINSEREVTLQIAQQNDTIVGSQVIAGNTVPTIGTQALTTTVTVPNQSTIVLGGLITESKERTTQGVPLIGRIPILGYFFRETKDAKDRSELIIMIQPTVIETPSEMVEASYEEQTRARVGQQIRRSEFRDNAPPYVADSDDFDEPPPRAQAVRPRPAPFREH